MMICIGQQYAYGFKSSHRSKCLIEVNPFNLSVSLSNETSFVSDNLTMLILFVVIDPFGADDIVLARIRTLSLVENRALVTGQYSH